MRVCLKLAHRVQTYVTTCNSIVFERFCVDSPKSIKTVAWTRIDRCIIDDNENAYFLKRISVIRALEKTFGHWMTKYI